ncbi:hypothetical protein [Demequina aurantiaca]|uniref:hypothetical protein n=1 Tax=Demequina aurantiaca TaxID=676200 RepID=UPI00128B0EC3|nr:hypothetical protein [Demequina aurantiaca]
MTAVRSAAVRHPATQFTPAATAASGSIKAPTTSAGIRDFDFAAAMFNDDNAWREMARAIASDAA